MRLDSKRANQRLEVSDGGSSLGRIGRSNRSCVRKNRIGLLAILLLSGLVSQPLAAGVTEVIPFSTGTFSVDYKNMIDGGESRKIEIPIPFYLIRHSKEGVILFDSGLGTRFTEEVRRSWLNRLLQLPLPYHLKEDEPAVRQLQKIGIPPEAVRTIIISHLHFDHAGGIRDFPNATVIVSQKEWDHATPAWGSGTLARLRGYIQEQFEGIKPRLGLVNYSPAATRGPFEASYDLFGDGSLILLSTPGHTPGHQSLLVTRDDGRKILLTGDAVWVTAGYEKPAPKGWLIRNFEESKEKAWETTTAIHHFHRENPNVLIIPGHDPDLWPQLRSLLK